MTDFDENCEIFSGYEGVAQYYDLFADSSDLPFYLEYARKTGSPVLDLCAGTGRVAVPLAESGLEVYALESSPSMIEEFKRKLESQASEIKNRIKLIQGDMTDFELEREFPLIIIPSSFGHAISTEEQISTLRCIKKHLSKDGIFILDLFPGESIQEYSTFHDSPVHVSKNQVVIRSGELTADRANSLLTVRLVFSLTENDKVIESKTVTSKVAIISNQTADNLVNTMGFHIEDEFGNFEKTPFNAECSRRILVLRHKKTDIL